MMSLEVPVSGRKKKRKKKINLTFEPSCIPLIFVSVVVVVISDGLVPKSKQNGQ